MALPHRRKHRETYHQLVITVKTITERILCNTKAIVIQDILLVLQSFSPPYSLAPCSYYKLQLSKPLYIP